MPSQNTVTMSLQGEVPQTLPTMPLPRTGLRFENEESQMESLSLGTLVMSNRPLSKALRLRSEVHSADEESWIESSKPKTLAVLSELIRWETMITAKPKFERITHIYYPFLPKESKNKPKSRVDSIREETQKFFDEIIPSTPCIFLCWGRPGDCRVIQIPLKDDGTWSFQELHDAWYAARGKWRRWLPIFGIVSVEPVQVRKYPDCVRQWP